MISEGSRVGRGVLMELASPQRFGEGHGPQWQAYAEALNILDGVWRTGGSVIHRSASSDPTELGGYHCAR